MERPVPGQQRQGRTVLSAMDEEIFSSQTVLHHAIRGRWRRQWHRRDSECVGPTRHVLSKVQTNHSKAVQGIGRDQSGIKRKPPSQPGKFDGSWFGESPIPELATARPLPINVPVDNLLQRKDSVRQDTEHHRTSICSSVSGTVLSAHGYLLSLRSNNMSVTGWPRCSGQVQTGLVSLIHRYSAGYVIAHRICFGRDDALDASSVGSLIGRKCCAFVP